MARQDAGPPRGTRDLMPADVARREQVITELARSYGRFGYRRIETPSIEDISRLSWGEGGENEKLIYRILRRGLDPVVEAGTALSDLVDLGLRYDLTVPLTRFYANNAGVLPVPFRAMQIGWVWRGERPAKGRYRQFTQCDIDILGEATILAECELLEASLAALAAIGIEPVHVRVNDRRILSAVAAEAGAAPEYTGAFFVALDKLDKIGWEGVRAELVGRGFPQSVGERCEWLVSSFQGAESPSVLLDRVADSLPSLDPGVLTDLEATGGALARLEQPGAPAGAAGFTWALDPTVVRGMGYYTGQIFEIGHADASGSIGGGGRYDGLIGRSLGREVPACGFSIGFDRVVEMAQFEPIDLGVAVLHSAEATEVVLAAARSARSPGRSVALVARRGQMKRQLAELEAEGYSSFVVVDGDSVSEERPFS